MQTRNEVNPDPKGRKLPWAEMSEGRLAAFPLALYSVLVITFDPAQPIQMSAIGLCAITCDSWGHQVPRKLPQKVTLNPDRAD